MAASLSPPANTTMEIQQLKLRVAERDLNELLARGMPPSDQVSGVVVSITAEGIQLRGVYHHRVFGDRLLPLPFSTLWEVGTGLEQITLRLARVKVSVVPLSVPLSMIQGFIMAALGGALGTAGGVHVEGDRLVLDLAALLLQQGVSLRLNLAAVRCFPGRLLIECASERGRRTAE